MDKQPELQQWLNIADSDLNLAIFSSQKMYPVPYAIICFHCQQAVEKYLKWFLVLHDFEPPKIHDLAEIKKLCEAINPQFSEISEKCSFLTGHAIQSRYPSEILIEKQDMDTAIMYAKEIREFMCTLYPDQFRSSTSFACIP